MAEANKIYGRTRGRARSLVQDGSLQNQVSMADTMQVRGRERTRSCEQRGLRLGGTLSSNVQRSGSALYVRPIGEHSLQSQESRVTSSSKNDSDPAPQDGSESVLNESQPVQIGSELVPSESEQIHIESVENDTRTESVIIPLGYTDNSTPAVPIVDNTKESAANSKSLFSEQLCNVHTEMNMSLEKEDLNLPNTSGVKLNESINRDSYFRYISPPKNSQSSPTLGKENILDAKISGLTVKDFAPALVQILNDRRYDTKPLVQMLFGSGSNVTNTAVSMGFFKVHHLVIGQKWDTVINNIITHIGISKLVYYLCKMPSIPHSVILESVLKNVTGKIDYGDLCNQLNSTELLKYVTSVHNLSDILKQYDTATVNQSLNEVRMDLKHNVRPFEKVLRRPYSVITPNPSDASAMMNNLLVVKIGECVIKRCGESRDMDTFLNTIFNKVSMNRYLQPVPKDMLVQSRVSRENTPEILDNITRCFIRKFPEGTVSYSVLKQLFIAVSSKMSLAQLLKANYEEMQKHI